MTIYKLTDASFETIIMGMNKLTYHFEYEKDGKIFKDKVKFDASKEDYIYSCICIPIINNTIVNRSESRIIKKVKDYLSPEVLDERVRGAFATLKAMVQVSFKEGELELSEFPNPIVPITFSSSDILPAPENVKLL